jgi:hypothetical protein
LHANNAMEFRKQAADRFGHERLRKRKCAEQSDEEQPRARVGSSPSTVARSTEPPADRTARHESPSSLKVRPRPPCRISTTPPVADGAPATRGQAIAVLASDEKGVDRIAAAATVVYSAYNRSGDALPTTNGLFSLNLIQGSVPRIAKLLCLKDGDTVGWIGVGTPQQHRAQL